MGKQWAGNSAKLPSVLLDPEDGVGVMSEVVAEQLAASPPSSIKGNEPCLQCLKTEKRVETGAAGTIWKQKLKQTPSV